MSAEELRTVLAWAFRSSTRNPDHMAFLAEPVVRDLMARAWDEGWDEYDNYAGGTGEPTPPRENPYRDQP